MDPSVEVVLDNLDSGSHPIHMHGHQFQVVFRGGPGELYDGTQALSPIPVRRDVIFVYTGASVVWRFVADNPGVYLLHWYVPLSFSLTICTIPITRTSN